MGLLYNCPVGSAIGGVELSNCPQEVGQIQRIWFTRKYSSGTTLNKLTVATAGQEPNLEATWTTLMAASDGTKVVASPYVNAPEFEAGEQILFGGGNQTRDDIEISMGARASRFNGMFYQEHQRSIKDIKDLYGENLAVWLINEHSQIVGLSEAGLGITSGTPASATEFYPIPIYQLFIGDAVPGGFEEPTGNAVSFKLEPNWSDNLDIWTTATTWNALDKTS